VQRLEQEIREVAVLEGRSLIGKLLLLAGGEYGPADALADAVQDLTGRREIGQARGAFFGRGHGAAAAASVQENHGAARLDARANNVGQLDHGLASHPVLNFLEAMIRYVPGHQSSIQFSPAIISLLLMLSFKKF
jgi:hypothetical protein